MITIPDELMIEGMARAFERVLAPAQVERVCDKIAELRAELLTTAEAAELLRVTPATLLKNHVEWGVTKSVALGADNPRFYRSQILGCVHAKEIRGREKVTEFPEPRRKAG